MNIIKQDSNHNNCKHNKDEKETYNKNKDMTDEKYEEICILKQ